MSKAEEYSFNIPSELFQQITKEQQVLWRKEIENTFNNGYHQAKKDLELTWEDMRELYIIFAEVDTEIELCKTDITAETLGYYQEVLKRFKAQKGE